MTNDIAVSVIIPVYNSARTLERAVRSVFAQTLTNLEIIAVDDCSQDNSLALLHQFAAEDSRLRVLSHTVNGGKPLAMNTGTAAAAGKWVAVLDSDDWFAPDRLAQLIARAEAAGVEMVADNQIYYDEAANASPGLMFPLAKADRVLDLDVYLREVDPRLNADIGMLKPIFLTEFVRTHKVDYYLPARLGEDFAILLDFFAKGGRGLLVKEAYYHYLQPFGSLSHQWAPGRNKPYNLVLMRQIGDDYAKILQGKITDVQMALLLRRGQRMQTVIDYQDFRIALRERAYGKALRSLAKRPVQIALLVAGRLLKRLCPVKAA